MLSAVSYQQCTKKRHECLFLHGNCSIYTTIHREKHLTPQTPYTKLSFLLFFLRIMLCGLPKIINHHEKRFNKFIHFQNM